MFFLAQASALVLEGLPKAVIADLLLVQMEQVEDGGENALPNLLNFLDFSSEVAYQLLGHLHYPFFEISQGIVDDLVGEAAGLGVHAHATRYYARVQVI